MSLQEVIAQLRTVEEKAEEKIRKFTEKADRDAQEVMRQSEEAFDKLKKTLEKKRASALKAAENKVAKETERIVAAGREEIQALATTTKSKRTKMKTAIRQILFP